MAPGWFGCPTGGWRGGPCAAVCCHLSTVLQPHGHRGGRGRDGTAYTCTPTPVCSVHLDLALDLLVDIVEKGAQSFLFDFAILTRLWPPSRRLKTAVYTIVCQLRKQLQVTSRFVLPAVEATGGMQSSRESAVLPGSLLLAFLFTPLYLPPGPQAKSGVLASCPSYWALSQTPFQASRNSEAGCTSKTHADTSAFRFPFISVFFSCYSQSLLASYKKGLPS